MKNKSTVLFRLFALMLVLTALSCASPKPVASATQTGDSQETAIVVGSVEEEHRWLNTRHPNVRVLMQETVQQSGKSYDVITVRTEEEQRITYYFDTSKFSRKK